MTILIVSVFALILIGVPIGISIGLATLISLAFNPLVSYEYISQFMYAGYDSFPLLSLPFFMLAGTIMDSGGLSKQLVAVADSVIGNVRGGLGYVTILACMLFGGISGSAPATVAAIGTIMIPQMVRGGYDKYYATGLVAVAGGLGVIVPPSFPLVIYGVTNNVSIGDLFLAGIGPAIVVGLTLSAANFFFARKYNYQGTGGKFEATRVLKTIWRAKFAMLMPVIILWGIYGGVFTPTEAAIVAVVYGLIVGVFIHRSLSIKEAWKMFCDNMPFMGAILLTFATAMQIASLFSLYKVSMIVNGFFLGTTSSLFLTLLMIFAILLIAGMFIETTPITIILSPILLAVVKQYGMDPVQFGLVLCLALCIAFVTPPVASNLFIASSLTGISMERIAKHALPFILMMLVALFIVALVPAVSIGILGR